MSFFLKSLSLQRSSGLKQPQAGKLIRELRLLAELTQEQFAAVLGVTYGTINRWENGHMQPSPLALKQIRAVLDEMLQSASPDLQAKGRQLLTQYFPKESGL